MTTPAGACGVLSLSALTLHQGQTNTELYAALKNIGGTPACSPAFSVTVFDKAENAVATGIAGVLVRRFYRLVDGSNTLAACVGPGDVSLLSIRDLPAELVIDDVGRLEYRCTFWALDVVPAGSLSVADVRSVPSESGVTFTGSLVNGLDVALDTPSVAVFSLNRVGRPLSVALAAGDAQLPPGKSWDFETNPVNDAGVEQAAYPTSGP
ncbi:MAG TPA: hypothetical protein VHP33_21570 [Polyangiaceae bacterium]|nr:hypothetical protein [Polyangiaceae bacterium]